ncbi:MAG: O-methyltransferase [Thermoplasmata archaeon]
MTIDTWTAVDAYFEEKLLPADPVLDEVLRSTAAAGLPSIQVSPTQGKLLHLLAKSQGARRILEIGTLGGYSSIWLARALPADGRLVTLELDPAHAQVAGANFARAGLGEKIELRLGPALESLPKLFEEKRGPFDLSFIDADKPNTRAYFEWSLKLSRPGALIVVDNVVRKGELANASSVDANVRGMRNLLDALTAEHRVSATGIQTVGSKGYDGFVLARVLEEPPPR